MVVAAAARADLLARVAALERELQDERASVRVGAGALQQASHSKEQLPLGLRGPVSPIREQTSTNLQQNTVWLEPSQSPAKEPLELQLRPRHFLKKGQGQAFDDRQQTSLDVSAWAFEKPSSETFQRLTEQVQNQSPLGLASHSSKAKNIQWLRFEIDEELTRHQLVQKSIAASREENLLLQKELDAQRSSQRCMLAEVRDWKSEAEMLVKDLDAQTRSCATSDFDNVDDCESLGKKQSEKLEPLSKQLKCVEEMLRETRTENALQREDRIQREKQITDEYMQLWHEHEASKARAEVAREKLRNLTAEVGKRKVQREAQSSGCISEDDEMLRNRLKAWQQQLEGRQQTQDQNREKLREHLEQKIFRHGKLREEFLEVQGDKYVLLRQISEENQAEHPFEPGLDAEEQNLMEHCRDTFRHWWLHQNSELEAMQKSIQGKVNAAECQHAQIMSECEEKRQAWAFEYAELEATYKAVDEEIISLQAAVKGVTTSQDIEG